MSLFVPFCFRMKLATLFGLASAGKITGDLTVTKEVTFTISQGGEQLGDVKIALFGNAVERTTDNFCQLADGFRFDDGLKGYEG